MRPIRIAIPSKGRLKEPALQLLSAVGIKPMASDDRALIIPTSWKDVQLVMIRTEDIPGIVEAGAADLGITGHDYIVESGADVEELLRLNFGEARLMLAVPQSWGVESVEELKGRQLKIATKYANIALNYIRERGLNAKIIRVSGSTEVMPVLGAADAVIDVVSTGTTLRAHGLKPIDVVMETYAAVIARREWEKEEKANAIRLILTMMKGALMARGRKLLLMNVEGNRLNEVLRVLPAMLSPAITRLGTLDAWEVITVVSEEELPQVIARAKEAGARDIVVVDIEKVIP